MNPQPPPSGPVNRGGQSCWLVGGIGCLIVLAVILIVFFVGMHAFMQSKTGKEFSTAIKSTIHGSREAVDCDSKMATVYAAISRYRQKTGKYPPTLAALTPDYLPDPTECHCSLDTNPSPSHSTFIYIPPTSKSRPANEILGFTWTQNIVIMQQTQSIKYHYYFTIAGKAMVQQTQTDSSGHTFTGQPMESPGAAAGS